LMGTGTGTGMPVTTPAAAAAGGAGNEYVSYEDVKTYLGITGTGDDDLLVDISTRASRIWDKLTRRFFYEMRETRYFDYEDEYVLHLNADLLSLITLTNGDGTEIESDDYILYPLNLYPKLRVECDKSTTGFVYTSTRQRAISILGLWGWHDDYDNAWASSGDAVQDDPLTAAATSLNVSEGGNFKVQQMLKIGDEQLYVQAISANALTVARGRNGTTAASHVKNTAISIWQPPADVVHWCLRLAAWLYRQKDAPFLKVGFRDLGVVEVPAALPPDIEEAAKRYGRVRV